MAVVGHADRLRLAAPADRHQHRTEDFPRARRQSLERSANTVRMAVAFAQRPGLRRQAAEDQFGIRALYRPSSTYLQTLVNCLSLMMVADVRSPRRADHRSSTPWSSSRACRGRDRRCPRAGTGASRQCSSDFLPGEAHGGDDAVDRPILVGVGIDDRGTLAEKHRAIQARCAPPPPA